MNKFLNIIGKRVSLRHTSPKYDIQNVIKVGFFCLLDCLCRKDIAVCYLCWTTLIRYCSCTLASKGKQAAFSFSIHSNFIQQCQSTMKLERMRIIVPFNLRPATRKLLSVHSWCFSPLLIHHYLSLPLFNAVIASGKEWVMKLNRFFIGIFLKITEKGISLQRTRQVHVLDIICSSYFLWLRTAFILRRYKGYLSHGLLQLCNNLDLAVREAIAFLFLILKFHNMPSPMKLEQKRSTVTSTSTSGNTKVAITLILVFFTFINPLLFVVPAALCGYSMKKGGCHEF